MKRGKIEGQMLKAKHGLVRKGKYTILLALARATVLREGAFFGDFSSFALEIYSCSSKKKGRKES